MLGQKFSESLRRWQSSYNFDYENSKILNNIEFACNKTKN